MYYLCTYFDQNYLARALALHRSLKRYCDSFKIYALCLDEESYAALSDYALPEIVLISLSALEKADAGLQQAKLNRSRIEYYFTCTAAFCLYLLENYPAVDFITYLDADLYFYSDPQPLYKELAESSVGLIEHRFAKRSQHYSHYGKYNVGWVSFRRDRLGLAALRWWRERCLEWCYDRVEETRFADQKYLDELATRFEGVRVIEHKGANVAAWNIANYDITESQGTVSFDRSPLIFFHFARFKQIKPWLYQTGFGPHLVFPSRIIRDHIFRPYILELKDVSSHQNPSPGGRRLDLHAQSLNQFVKSALRVVRGLLFREYVLVVRDQVY